ncbi:hypothetical protein J4Q44_G00095000 [Coregonus suidteri]|uniref:Nuclear receptor 2C2-associated protein n=1 Tax=Coregonus suidteri TaxID=861788 RepID=A0AAN8LZ88_9TELE
MASSLICSETQSRVSSVLNRDVKQFGKKYMFDSNEEACWNSDQNSLNSSGNGQGRFSVGYSGIPTACQSVRIKGAVPRWLFRENVQIGRMPKRWRFG